jgi:hypothetical protein
MFGGQKKGYNCPFGEEATSNSIAGRSSYRLKITWKKDAGVRLLIRCWLHLKKRGACDVMECVGLTCHCQCATDMQVATGYTSLPAGWRRTWAYRVWAVLL